MKIKNIKINSYGNLQNKEINLKEKINIIYGKNESGKSTLLNFIINSFYGISKNKKGKEISDYEKYMPWNGEEFSGKISYELDNKENYEVFRDFHKKSPKVYNSNMEDVTKQYHIDKNMGNQFFVEHTKLDEEMFKNTLVSMQQEVRLDNQTQNSLVQKVANLAGTGDDEVSYQKALNKLNKKQLEEIGTDRSKDKPINIVQNRMKNIQLDLKTNEENEKQKNEIKKNKELQEEKIIKLELLNNLIMETKNRRETEKIKKEKIEFNKKIIEENKNKINNLIEEKNKLEINHKNKTNNLNKIKKVNNKIYLIIFIILIIINLINFNLIKNKIINFLLLSLIPILIIIYLINFKLINNKNKINNKKILEEENKIKNENEILNSQIQLLEKNNKEQLKEIEIINKELEESEQKIKEELENKYKNKLPNYEIENILECTNLEIKERESINELNSEKIKWHTLEIEEKNISLKLENKISLLEELENLDEQKKELEEKNNYINKAREYLGLAYEKMKSTVTPKFTNNLSETIKKIANGKYKKITINDETGMLVELENGEYIPASRLSVGTIDQLYLSLRLSMINEITNEKMPIMLDETFAYFDDERLKNVLNYLITEYPLHQIIIFTCSRREEEILNKMNIEYNLVNL